MTVDEFQSKPPMNDRDPECPPRTWPMPKLPPDVTLLRDREGRLWRATDDDAQWGRMWRFRSLAFSDHHLLASIYGPTFTEVIADPGPDVDIAVGSELRRS